MRTVTVGWCDGSTYIRLELREFQTPAIQLNDLLALLLLLGLIRVRARGDGRGVSFLLQSQF